MQIAYGTETRVYYMSENEYMVPESLLVVAGWGVYPRLVVEGAKAAGVRRVSVLGFRGSTLAPTCAVADDFKLVDFKVRDFTDALAASGCRHAVMAGQINPLSLFRMRMDPELLRELSTIKIRNAHTLFGRVIDIMRTNGVEVLPSSLFMGAHIPAPGLLTRVTPNERELADVAFGNEIAMQICNLDIGQTVVVKEGVVLAVEGFDGTNPTIKRGGKIGVYNSVVVKVAKENHDMRFDIPVIGTKTIRVLKRAKISTLGVQAGRTIVLDLPEVIRRAEAAGIAIVSTDSGLPKAPVAGGNA